MATSPVTGEFRSGPLALRDAALFTDLYELTMAAAYFREGMRETASFSLFARRLPGDPGVHRGGRAGGCAGVRPQPALHRRRHPVPEVAGALRAGLPRLSRRSPLHRRDRRGAGGDDRLPRRADPRGDGPGDRGAAAGDRAAQHRPPPDRAGQQGRAAHARGTRPRGGGVRAPPEPRDRRRHQGRALRLDRGLRIHQRRPRGRTYGIPLSGTMAHSFVTAFEDELEAFRAYARSFPTRGAADRQLRHDGGRPQGGVVAQSWLGGGTCSPACGSTAAICSCLSREVRRILDSGGCTGVRIIASGGLDERDIERLLARARRSTSSASAPGTTSRPTRRRSTWSTSWWRYGGRDVLKLSEGKETWVGRKALYRMRDGEGRMAGDVLALADEPAPVGGGQSLLQKAMRDGVPVGAHPPLAEVRRHCIDGIAALPEGLRRLEGHGTYAVRASDGLRERQEQAIRRVRGKRT